MLSTYHHKHKPDLVLLENKLLPCNEILWKSPKVLAELTRELFTPTACIARTLDTKAYLIMIESVFDHSIVNTTITMEEMSLLDCLLLNYDIMSDIDNCNEWERKSHTNFWEFPG